MTVELKERVLELLKKINDPEIPVSVYDLGLIYDLSVKDGVVDIKMTVTSVGCPLTFYLPALIEERIKSELPEVREVNVELVWDPPWTPERITEEGRRRLKELYGRDVVADWLSTLSGA